MNILKGSFEYKEVDCGLWEVDWRWEIGLV